MESRRFPSMRNAIPYHITYLYTITNYNRPRLLDAACCIEQTRFIEIFFLLVAVQ